MNTTRPSLLIRVKNRDDAESWREFDGLYRPLLMKYAHRRGLSEHDAEDIAQGCLATVSQRIRDFKYDPRRGRFRAWLKTVVNHLVSDLLRKRLERSAESGELRIPQCREESPEDVFERTWEEEHLRYCLRPLREEVEPQTYDAFRLYAIDHWPIKGVCKALDMTPNQVYLAKHRIVRRLREKIVELFGDVA